MKRLIFITLFLMIITQAYYVPAAERFGDISIDCHAPSEGQSSHGYFEYRMTVTNNSRERSHQVTISFPRDTRARGNSIRSVSRSVTVAPGSAVTFPMFQPPLPLSYGGKTDIYIDGVRHRKFLKISYSQHCVGYYRTAPACILVSNSLNRDDLLVRFGETGLVPDSPESMSLVRSKLAPESWTMNWLSYSRYDGIILKNTDMEAMPVPVKSALHSYVRCGGTLVITGDSGPPGVLKSHPGTLLSGMTVYDSGFGQYIIIPVSNVRTITYKQLEYLDRSWRETRKPFKNIRNSAEANKAFPIIRTTEINTRGIFIAMLVFVILVGPVNFIILARKKKKIWMLWTIPCISLLTCASIFLYAIFSEGLDSDIRTSGFTILDQASHEATTLGITAFYCRLTPGEGLRFPSRTELTPMVSRSDYTAGTPRTIDWTTDQHLKSGWVSSRVPAHFMVRKNETRRERVQASFSDPDKPTVVNGLGAKIKKLWLADEHGRIFSGAEIPAGSRAVLKPTGMRTVSKTNSHLRRTYTSFSWDQDLPEHKAVRLLLPNTYVTMLDGCPFIEKGLTEPDGLDLNATVFGIMENIKEAHGNQS